jgi:preprotein translocase subunit Sss1
MCDGFGGFYHKDGKVYFTTPDDNGDCSHIDIARNLPKGINESDLIPFEVPDWSARKFHWDATCVPAWTDNAAKLACIAKLKEVKPVWAKYEKVTAPAWAEYEKVTAAAWAEYEKVRAPAWAEYKKVRAPAQAEYKKVRAPAWAEYKKVRAPALAEY